MVSFSFGKKRRMRRSNLPGYKTYNRPSLNDIDELSGLDFGKRRKTRSLCSRLRSRSGCASSASCRWTRGRGCLRKGGAKRSSPDFAMHGDEDLGSYAAASGIEFFGKRRRARRGMRRGRRGARRTRRKVRRHHGVRKVRRHRGVRRTRRKVRRTRRKVRRGVRRTRRKVRRTRRKVRRSVSFGSSSVAKPIMKPPPKMGTCKHASTKVVCDSMKGTWVSFGRRRHRKVHRTRRKVHRKVHRKSKKLPAKIRKLCKKLKIKTTKKVGSRRVYKKLSVLKKQIARKMRRSRR